MLQAGNINDKLHSCYLIFLEVLGKFTQFDFVKVLHLIKPGCRCTFFKVDYTYLKNVSGSRRF